MKAITPASADLVGLFPDLPPNTLSAVGDHLEAVRANHLRSIALACENGKHFAAVKILVGHGHWTRHKRELARLAGYESERTVERHMKLYEAAGDGDHIRALIDSGRATLSALYRLTASGTPVEALELALAVVGKGERVTADFASQTAYVRAVYPALLEAVKDDEITLPRAHALAQAVQGMPERVAALAVKTLADPEVIPALYSVYQREPDAFDEIEASGAIYNPAASADVPLSRARPDDFNADLRARRQRSEEWLGTVKGDRDTVLHEVERLCADDGVYKITVIRLDNPPI